jgi:site-specific recombinase XerD
MTLHVEQGKGRKDRYAMLSPVLLDILRRWWREGHANGLLLDGGWLFPGQDPVNPLSTRQLSRAIRAAAASAEIDKRVSMHLLRHSYGYSTDPGITRPPSARDYPTLYPGGDRCTA